MSIEVISKNIGLSKYSWNISIFQMFHVRTLLNTK